MEPDTIEELIEAMKIMDYNKDGTIEVNELRWAMTNQDLGEQMEEQIVDEMIGEITANADKKDPNNIKVDIIDFAKIPRPGSVIQK